MKNPTGKLQEPEEDGAREVFSPQASTLPSQSSPKKVYPAGTKCDRKHSLSKTKEVIALVVCICLAWTIWLIFLNVAPNHTVNRIMRTETFDYGSFWLFIDASEALVILATLGLSIVAVAYVSVLVKLLWRKPTKQPRTRRSINQIHVNVLRKVESSLHEAVVNSSRSSRVATATIALAASLSQADSSTTKVTCCFSIKYSSPARLLCLSPFCTLIVAANALSCAAIMFISHDRAPRVEIFIDILFDFMVVVAYPMLVIVYCLSTFSFNRAKLAINLEVFPPGWYEQSASVIVDPAESAVIYQALKTLRIMSVLTLFTRIGVNLTLCFRLWQVAELIQSPGKLRSSVYPKRNRPAATLLVLLAILLVLFAEESLRTSNLACQPHPECVVNARRWTRLDSGSSTQCPCLILVDRDIAPATYAEWMNPRDVTANVAQLASTGDLQTLQLTNCFLPVLPDELRRCSNLRHLSLEYTHTQTFPPWANEFTKLEFLHIESKSFSAMAALSEDLFDGMASLTFIHLAAFSSMVKLPSLNGLTNLKSLTLAGFLFLEELPAFDNLHNLERLVLAILPSLNALPDFAPVKKLTSFATLDRGAWCCNGFLGDCDLSNDKCGVHPVWGLPAATCLASESKATEATLASATKFSFSICGAVLGPEAVQGTPTEETMAVCKGAMYRQCNNPNELEAMCYNVRFMGITCTPNSYAIEMRRRQIAQSVGDPCDPEVEAWLGCV
ncbi:hypothetical protein PHYPSEUDO_006949 [Phytophthora pseudosyringae]|uniref:WLGC domain-containing protein n=1 Tax=Phytophthora pseudosyringae TaxID=221518 RepID=A0A8T1VKD4_9STRA|nr:hypothetical protein PHYPSEUDO_006949 [Phytophthora pseudosyringae]